MWLIFAVFSAFFAGITSILAKVGIKNTDSNLATAIRTIIILLFAWLMVFITGGLKTIDQLDSKSLIFLILSGFATGASWLCYFKALSLGDINKVTPVDKSSTVLTMILAIIILGESISVLKVVCIILIGAGTFLMIDKKKVDEKGKKGGGWLLFGILSAVFASLTSILGKIGITGIDSNLGTAIRTIVVLLMAWLVVFATKKDKPIKLPDNKSLLFICLSGITTGMSWLCYYRALKDGDAGIVVPIDKLSILVSIAFSFVVFKEKLSAKALVGLVMITGGTLLLLRA